MSIWNLKFLFFEMPNWHFKSLHIQLPLNPKFIDPLAQRRARDAEQLRGVNLVVVGFLQRLDDEFAFDGGDLTFNFGSRLAH